MQSKRNEYDVIIIGFGKAGKTLASEFAGRGYSVAMVEASDRMYGGTCINIGCIPTKALIHAALLAPKTGDMKQKQNYFEQSMKEKDRLVSALRKKNYDLLAQNPLITIFNGFGSFSGTHSVRITDKNGKEREIRGEKIIINTGSESFIPPIEGIKGNPYVKTSTELLEVKVLPPRLTIIGGGYIGLEFASMFASFGSQVTVLDGGSEFIPREDRDVADALLEALQHKGVKILLNSGIKRIEEKTVLCSGTADQEEYSVEGDLILVATGRRPRISGLNLEKAGVELTERGAIKVNRHLQTTQEHIFAAGDVNGGLQFTYISLDDYRVIRSFLWEDASKTAERRFVSYSVFTDPPLSRVGVGEKEAESKRLSFAVRSLPVSSIPRARTLRNDTGLFKVIIDKSNNQILGCTLFGAESSEIINIIALCMENNLPYTVLKDFIFTHPSMAESLNDLMNFNFNNMQE